MLRLKRSKMGIVKNLLAEFELSDGEVYRIEYNEGDVIHIHVGSMRIGMSKSEFLEFADTISDGYEQLSEDKNLD